ncbi:MAG: MXAN_2562 family outer membrane beta-barrel protein [Myxococcota bacterium]
MRTRLDRIVLLAVLGFSIPAAAQVDERRPYNGIGLKVGPFQPNVSDSGVQREFYGQVFSREDPESESRPFTSGLTRAEPMYTLDIDYYLVTRYGLLGLTGSVGYWSINGATRVCPQASDGSTCNPDASEDDPDSVTKSVAGNDSTRLTTIPITFGIVYKWDELKRRFRYFPFVPYVKGGITYTYWRNTAGGDGTVRTGVNDSGNSVTLFRGRGGHFGLFGTVGLALNLDWIEPQTARSARSTGMVDTYLFVEGTTTQNDGFGGDRLDFSDMYWQVGLSVDFE